MLDKIVKGLIMAGIICVIIICVINFVWAGEKEELSLEWRALVAEYNLAFEKWQQINPQFNALKEFQQKLEAKGFTFDKTGKIIEKPKPQEKKPESEKK